MVRTCDKLLLKKQRMNLQNLPIKLQFLPSTALNVNNDILQSFLLEVAFKINEALINYHII